MHGMHVWGWKMCAYLLIKDNRITVRAPVFGRHYFFGTSEHYGKAHGSLLSGWMNYNYTACRWFPTSSNILILPSQFWQIRFESYWLPLFKVPNTGAFTVLFFVTRLLQWGLEYALSIMTWQWNSNSSPCKPMQPVQIIHEHMMQSGHAHWLHSWTRFKTYMYNEW